MESKPAGDLSLTPCDLERELQSIYQSSDPKEQKMEKVLLLLDLYHSHESTQP
jgi:hypothetical protein